MTKGKPVEIEIVPGGECASQSDAVPKRSPQWASILIYSLVCLLVLRSVPFATWTSETEADGRKVDVMTWWRTPLHYLRSDSPTWQKRTYPDGTTAEGGIVNNARHGRWRIRTQDKSTSWNYEHGTKQLNEKQP